MFWRLGLVSFCPQCAPTMVSSGSRVAQTDASSTYAVGLLQHDATKLEERFKQWRQVAKDKGHSEFTNPEFLDAFE